MLSGGWWFELITDVYFIVDIVLNFHTAYFEADEVLEFDLHKIRLKYLTTWFIVDFISCLPITYIQLFIQLSNGKDVGSMTAAGGNFKAFKALRLIRLAKLLRLAKLRNLVIRYEEQLDSFTKLGKLLFVAILVVYVCHVFGCLWFYVGAIAEDETNTTSWLHQVRIIKECSDQTWPPAWAADDSMVDYSQIACQATSHTDMYLISFYWAITVLSTVGYGDISANNSTERLFSSFVALLGCFLFAVLIGSLGSALMSERILDSKVERQVRHRSSASPFK